MGRGGEGGWEDEVVEDGDRLGGEHLRGGAGGCRERPGSAAVLVRDRPETEEGRGPDWLQGAPEGETT